MATTQYIGARYVPLIYGDWQANTTYEPLTIVLYNGSSYTSKKVVPPNIGTPDSNPTYWANTGNFNAQVEALRIQVQHLAEEVGGEDDRISNLENSEIQFNVSEAYNSLDIICAALESVLSIKQRNNTLAINNNSEDVEIYVQGTTLFINTEV